MRANRCSRLCLLVLGLTTVKFALEVADQEHMLCVRVAGGFGDTRRAQSPLRLLFWVATGPLIGERTTRNPPEAGPLAALVYGGGLRYLTDKRTEQPLKCVLPMWSVLDSLPACIRRVTAAFPRPPLLQSAVALAGELAGSSHRLIRWAMGWAVASLASGALCSFTESRPAWVAGTILAFGAEAVTLASLRSILQQGMRAAPDAATRRLWIAISAVVAGVWVVILLLWALGQADVLSMAAERVLLPPLDIISKVG